MIVHLTKDEELSYIYKVQTDRNIPYQIFHYPILLRLKHIKIFNNNIKIKCIIYIRLY